MKSRSKTKEKTGENGKAAGECENAPVDVRIGKARRVRRN
jgi:hypothetical protein